MDNSTIGIKIADGTYFPILEEAGSGKKKLVLTTVNDDQGSVQIDLYKGEGQELHDAMYIGSLVIEDIMPAMKGDPEIELIIGVDDDGNLNAEAGDAGSTERQSLSVSLKSLNEAEFSAPNFELDDSDLEEVEVEDDFTFEEDDLSLEEDDPFDETEVDELSPIDDDMIFDEVPSFEDEVETDEVEADEISSLDDDMGFDEIALDDEPSFEEEPSFDEDLSFESESDFENEPDSLESFTEDDEKYKEEYKKKRSPIALIILIILILAILGLGALLIIRGMNSDTVPPLEAENTPAVTTPEVVVEPANPAESEPSAPVEDKVAEQEAVEEVVVVEPPVEEVKQAYDTLPPEGHGGGVWYRLKWGDTLWDLSNSFYRTPWLYGLIAVENKIKNPDLIYAGTDILIPEN